MWRFWREKKKGQSLHFPRFAKVEKQTEWWPHRSRCAAAGGAAQRRVPPGWLCTLPGGPASAAGCAQPRLCRPRPSGPPPGSAPAPAADAPVCSHLGTTSKGKVRPKRPHRWTLEHQNASCTGAHTVLWVLWEPFRWVQGSFSAPLWVYLSLHKPNAVLFGALGRCSKQRRQTMKTQLHSGTNRQRVKMAEREQDVLNFPPKCSSCSFLLSIIVSQFNWAPQDMISFFFLTHAQI